MRGIFTLTFKEQTQCSVGWHICLLFHSKIKLLSMWKFKSSRVAVVSRRFFVLFFFLYVWAAQCPRLRACVSIMFCRSACPFVFLGIKPRSDRPQSNFSGGPWPHGVV